MRKNVQYYVDRFASENQNNVKRVGTLRFRAGLERDKGRSNEAKDLVEQADALEAVLYSDESESFALLMTEEEAEKFIEIDIIKSNRKEHDRACAVTAFKKIYGKDLTGSPAVFGINVPDGYELKKVKDERTETEKAVEAGTITRCVAIKKDGNRCKMKAVTSDGFCRFHADQSKDA